MTEFGDTRLPLNFWSKVSIADNGCWIWTKGKTGKGYGAYAIKRVVHLAHRVSYTALVGDIPDGLQIDHGCRDHACVNPDHLEPVTGRENLMRGGTLAAANAAKTHCPNNHPYSGNNLLISRGRRICRTCNRERMRTRRLSGRREK